MSTHSHTVDDETDVAEHHAAAFETIAEKAAEIACSADSHYVESQARDMESHARTMADGLEDVGAGDELPAYVHGNMEVRR